MATGDPPANRPQPTIGVDTATATNITFGDYTNALTVATTNDLYLEPGTNVSIQPGALGGSATIRTAYDDRTMDRLIYFDNGVGTNTGGTITNNYTVWTNGTAAIENIRIQEAEWRMQQNQRQAAQYLQGRINDHLNQQMDNQFARRVQQGQAAINIDNYDNVYNPFGGGLQGQPRHEPPNLDTPRAIAEVRGKNLLKNIIGDVLYRHYEKNGYVDLPSIEKPGVGFRIRAHRRIGLLKRNRQGQWVEQKESLCIHAAGGYWVEGDQVGIHYMLCQCDEKKLWKQAIIHKVAA